MSEKPNCYECKWRRNLAGDCHSRCSHPQISQEDEILTPLFMILGKVSPLEKRMNVRFDEYGIKMGWAAFPINFDPTWIVTCDGFEKSE